MKPRSKFRARINELKPSTQANEQTQPNVKVVEVKHTDAFANIVNTWGHFSGNYAEWPGFCDRFKARMRDRDDVPITHKWGHLRASLSGEALRALGNWQDTDSNYKHAWNRLCSRYNDDYMAVHTLIKRLLNIQLMQQPSNVAIRNIVDTVHECLSPLNAYVSTDTWDPLIIFLVVDKLDNETRREWEKYRHTLLNIRNENTDANDSQASQHAEETQSNASNFEEVSANLPTWTQMEEFLNQQAKILRDSDHQKASGTQNKKIILKILQQRKKPKWSTSQAVQTPQ